MKRVIMLVDMNAFFISCETTRHPELSGVPSAVAGDPQKRTGIIFAANYEARSFGVKTTMTVNEATKLCPHIKLVPPDHTFYEIKSKEVMAILDQYSPILEQNSIDEAFLDLSGCEGLYESPLSAAQSIMKDIHINAGLYCSIGISYNKFLSKMASEIKKPQGITEIWEEDVKNKLWPLTVGSMYGVGKQTSKRLIAAGIKTIGELAAADTDFLIKTFGNNGIFMHNAANGIDDSPVIPHTSDEIKSIGRSTTLSEDITDINKVKPVLLMLTDDICMSARRYCKTGHTVQITIKYSDFHTITRQIKVPPTNSSNDVYRYGCELLYNNWDSRKPIRLIGISLTGFDESSANTQISMFDILSDKNLKNEKDTKNMNLEKVIDRIKYKYGSDIISRAILIKKDSET